MLDDINYINPNNWESGIYKISAPTGHYYYGSAKDLKYRCFYGHFCELRHNRHNNKHMQRRFNKYPAGWIFEVIRRVEPIDSLLIQNEQIYLTEFHGNNLCMNINPVAGRPIILLGRKCTQETKDKIRKARLGTTRSKETCKRISQSKLGRKFTVQHIENMRKARLGKPCSEEKKAKIRATLLGRKRNILHF